MNYIKIFILILLCFTIKAQSQDIIVLKNSTRIKTKVISIGKDTVSCREIDSIAPKKELILLVKEIDKILLEIGSVYDYSFDDNIMIPTFHVKKQSNIVNTTLKKRSINEFGFGTTGGILLTSSNSNKAPFQFNYRLLFESKNKENRRFGFNLNYSSKILMINDCRRTAIHFVYQENISQSKNHSIYGNIMVGAGYFAYVEKYYNYEWNNGELKSVEYKRNRSMLLPSVHLGLGFKIKLDDSTGILLEGGIGGNYLLNVGFYFK